MAADHLDIGKKDQHRGESIEELFELEIVNELRQYVKEWHNNQYPTCNSYNQTIVIALEFI